MKRAVKEALALLRAADQSRAATGQLTVVDLTHLPASAVEAAVELEYGMAPAKRDALVRRWREALTGAKKARGLARMLREKGASDEGQLARAARLAEDGAALARQLGLTVTEVGEEGTVSGEEGTT